MSLTAALVALQLKNVYSCFFHSWFQSNNNILSSQSKVIFYFFLQKRLFIRDVDSWHCCCGKEKKKNSTTLKNIQTEKSKTWTMSGMLGRWNTTSQFIKRTTELINQISQHTQAYITFCRELSLTVFHFFVVFAQRRCSDLWDSYQVWGETVSHV